MVVVFVSFHLICIYIYIYISFFPVFFSLHEAKKKSGRFIRLFLELKWGEKVKKYCMNKKSYCLKWYHVQWNNKTTYRVSKPFNSNARKTYSVQMYGIVVFWLMWCKIEMVYCLKCWMKHENEYINIDIQELNNGKWQSEQNTRSPHCFNGQLYGRFLVSRALILKQMTALCNSCSFEHFDTSLLCFFLSSPSLFSLNFRSHSIGSFLPTWKCIISACCHNNVFVVWFKIR